ncbi:MAG: MBL fold metallo-hydrolase [Flavitalea sp.]
MFIQQLYTACLSEAAYYIESNGEAAVIDPLRDIETYMTLAKERNASIKYIFETHFHADFVSGHLDLQKATGATIVYGPNTETRFRIHKAKDGEVFQLGDISITALHTPGHTLESTCYLLKEANGNPYALFTGDTLFVNEVGRPDLGNNESTMEELAGLLYESLHEKILPLPDHVIVYPAHGPGSSCGKNLGPGTSTTIGDQKKDNYALQATGKEEFVRAVTDGLKTPPKYFEVNARINKEGYESLSGIMEKALVKRDVLDFKQSSKQGDKIILDTRHSDEFAKGFIPGSIGIGLNGRFAEWAGSLLPFDQPILLITEEGQEKESVTRLARVGFTEFAGYLDGGFDAWINAGELIDLIIDVEADELAMDIPFDDNLVVLDVRRETEFGNAHVKDAINIPLEEMTDPASMANIEDTHNLYVHCASGYRSVIACSMLKRQGIHNIRNVIGGFNSISEEKRIEIEKDDTVLN